jgi:hypothetical protein
MITKQIFFYFLMNAKFYSILLKEIIKQELNAYSFDYL